MKARTNLAAIVVLALALSTLPLHAAATGHFERTLQVSGAVDPEVMSGSGEITVRTVEGADHFYLILPDSSAFTLVHSAVQKLVGQQGVSAW